MLFILHFTAAIIKKGFYFVLLYIFIRIEVDDDVLIYKTEYVFSENLLKEQVRTTPFIKVVRNLTF